MSDGAKGGTGRMDLSRNETENLCMKAARGAGFSWGHAEEAGFAAGWLAAQGIDGATPLMTLLNRKLERPDSFGKPIPGPRHWHSLGSPLCPIQLGAALTDRAHMIGGPFSQETTLDPVEMPILLLPFLVRIAHICQASLTVDRPGGRLGIAKTGDFDGLDAAEWSGDSLLAIKMSTSSEGGAKPAFASPNGRPAIPVSTVARLERLALRTTVPESNSSRSGAGSDTADND